MKHSTGLQCIELGTGANIYKPPEEDSRQPDNFIDRNTYHYRTVNGVMVLKGITLGPGWENRSLKREELSCFVAQQKGEKTMVGRQREDKAEILAKAKELMEKEGLSMNKAATQLGVPVGTLRGWLNSENKKKGISINPEFEKAFEQTPNPEQETVGSQAPAQGAEESANESVTQVPQGDNDFTAEDNLPIPFLPVERPDLGPVKIQLIATVLCEYREDNISANIALGIIQGIQDLQLPEVG